MKKLQFLLVALFFTGIAAQAQLPTKTLSGFVDGVTRNLVNDTVYIINGFYYVKNGGILNIEPGTIIRGDKDSKGTLIVCRNGKIYANGTPDQPIVFTSNQPEGSRNYGDWGGVILLGNAPINVPGGVGVIEGGVDNEFGDGQYGGANPADNSGSMTYVRIEYPGIAFVPDNEINGLTFGGVGYGTTINHIMVSFSGDDSYEWFGGTVRVDHMIAYKGWDDDFDTDFGFQGTGQFLLSKRDPNIADVSGSNGFESDNDGTGTTNTPQTDPTFSNVTIVGAIENAGDVINANYKRGAHLRRNTSTDIFNSVIIGYPVGVLIDGALCEASCDADQLKIRNTIIAGMTTNFAVAAGSTWDVEGWFTTPSFNNEVLTNSTDVMLNDAYNVTSPNFLPSAGSPLLSGASFADPFLAGFEPTTYRGAFGNEDWTLCWANWDPQNTNYGETAGTIAQAIANFSTSNAGLSVTFDNLSSNAVSYMWDLGDAGANSTEANPTYTYPDLGIYYVTLDATGTCGDISTTTKTLDLSTAIAEIAGVDNITIYPNPAKNEVHVIMLASQAFDANIHVTDVAGNEVMPAASMNVVSGTNTLTFDCSTLESGLYFVTVQTEGAQQTSKLIIAR
ncbi:MAG: T9SS type A sorting domain-containing protein [Chitinophagales bacterium]